MRIITVILLCGIFVMPLQAAAKMLQLPKRPDSIVKLLPNEFLFGTSWFGKHRDWPVERYEQDGIRWGFIYTYVFPNTKKREGTQQIYVDWVCDKAKRTKSFPIFSMYGLLNFGRDEGYKGSEVETIPRVCKNKDLMRQYFLENKRVMQLIQSKGVYAIFHSEPDSWAFLEWHATNDTHDANQCEVMVKSTGIPELAEFPDTAAGMGQALIKLRDLYAPNLYMGFHCKDCRVGNSPELTVKFMKSLGKWDILLGDGIGHVYDSRNGAWWDTFSQARFDKYKIWFSTVSKGMNLPYIHWQSVVGKSDFTILEDYPNKQRVNEYIKMGSIGVCFDIRDPDHSKHPSDGNHGYSNSPPADHPAYNTVGALIERLKKYYKDPMSLDGRFKSNDVEKEKRALAKKEKEAAREKAKQEKLAKKESAKAKLKESWKSHIDRLKVECDRQLKSGREIYFVYSMLKKEVTLKGITKKGYDLSAGGGVNMSINIWKRFTEADAAALSAAMRKAGGEEGHALAAYFALVNGNRGKAIEYLQRAGSKGQPVRALMK